MSALKIHQMIKASGVPPPNDTIKTRLTQSFGDSHPNSCNHMPQTLRDWERIARRGKA